jgi:hypothetical protein
MRTLHHGDSIGWRGSLPARGVTDAPDRCKRWSACYPVRRKDRASLTIKQEIFRSSISAIHVRSRANRLAVPPENLVRAAIYGLFWEGQDKLMVCRVIFHSSPAGYWPKTPPKRSAWHPINEGQTVIRILGLIGATIGSAIGWWLGARIGLMTAFFISTLGAGFGLYYGTRLARHWLP